MHSTISKVYLGFMAGFVKSKLEMDLFWIKCRIPGTKPTSPPVSFTRELVGQMIFFHFFNSIMNIFAWPLVGKSAESLVNLFTGSLVNIYVG